ncbi:hypothetical protein ACFLXC_03490 [Chloroflexota bacterium]
MRKLIVIGGTIILMLAMTISGCSPEPTSPIPKPASPAAKLVFVTQPSHAASGLPFPSQPLVAVQNERGEIVSNYMGYVDLAINTGTSGASIFGGVRLVVKEGMVEFKDLFIDKAGENYTLKATSRDLTSAISDTFKITSGEAASLKFAVQPTGAVAGTTLRTQPEIVVEDAFGNRIPDFKGPVTVQVTPIASLITPVLHGTTKVEAIDGVARFTDLSIQRAFPYFTLTATSQGLTSVVSREFRISPAEAKVLEITVPPEGAVAGQLFEQQPKVAIVDVYGNVVASSTDPITLAIMPGSGIDGAVLSGETTVGAVDGLAIFWDLSIDLAGEGYMLTAICGQLTPDISNIFDVINP